MRPLNTPSSILFLVLCGMAGTARSGAFVFTDIAATTPAGANLVTHPIGYNGNSGNVNVRVCIVPGSPFASQMQIPVENIVDRFNLGVPTQGNVRSGSDNELAGNQVDFESVALHELGHCIGLAHTNLASESQSIQPSLSDAQLNATKSAQGSNGVFNVAAGSDGLFGSADDQRGDDINLHWFFTDDNNPFTLPASPESANYSRDLADLPSGDDFVTNADLAVSTNPPFNLLPTEGVMQQGTRLDEDQRTLAADEVATLMFARNGEDRDPGGGDDYSVTLEFAGVTASNCDINVEFDNVATGFAQCNLSSILIGPDNRALTNADVFFNTGFNWFFSDQLIPLPVADSLSVASGFSATQLDGGATSVLDNDDDRGEDVVVSPGSFLGPDHGSVTLNSDGTFEYIHDGQSTEPDRFVYRVCVDDGAGGESFACAHQQVDVNVFVTNNNPPVPQDDTAMVTRGGTVTLLDGGGDSVLDNDSDPNNDDLTVDSTPVSGPLAGALTLNPDGTFSYTHDGSAAVSDAFVYRVCDDGAPSFCAQATVSISVDLGDAICSTPDLAIPDQGTRTDTLMVAESGILTDLDLLLDISHPAVGDIEVTLMKDASVRVVDNPGLPAMPFGCERPNLVVALDDEATDPVEDACSPTGNAVQGTFTPDDELSAFDGESLDGSWSLRVRDQIQQQTGTLNRWCLVPTLSAIPVANDDSGFLVAEAGTVMISAAQIKANDTDAEDGIPGGPIRLVGQATQGTAQLQGQTVSFTHEGESGPSTFQYQVEDSHGSLSNIATVTIAVTFINDPPVAVADAAFTDVDVPVDIDVAANDTDVDGNVVPTSVALSTPPGNGSAVILASGQIRYTPGPGFNGLDQLEYVVSDDGSPGAPETSSPGHVTIAVGTVPFAACGPFGRRLVAGQPAALDASAAFTGGPFIGFSATGLPGSLTIDGAGLISGNLSQADAMASPYAVVVTADDGLQTEDFAFRLTVDASPQAIFFSDIEDGCFGQE